MQLSRHSQLIAADFGLPALGDGLFLFASSGAWWVLGTARGEAAAASRSTAIAADPGVLAPGLDPGPAPVLALDLQAGGLPRILLFAAAGGALAESTLLALGTPSAPLTLAPPAGPLTAVTALVSYAAGGTVSLVMAQRGTPGLQLFDRAPGGGLVPDTALNAGPKSYLQDVVALITIDAAGSRYVIAASQGESGISAHRIGADGSLTFTDSIGAGEGLGIAGPSDLEPVILDGAAFVCLAARESASITVLRLNAAGVFFLTDHLVDDRQTRFDHVGAIDSFAAAGRPFLLAAGSDAGLSLFELLPDGRLDHMASSVFETGPGMAAVTGIDAAPVPGGILVATTDVTGAAISLWTLDTSGLGPRLAAGPAGGTVTGTALDDRLLGSSAADTLIGGDGADRLTDGGGQDLLTGGAGADVFLLSRDGLGDVISDFQLGQDRLDLSDWGRIYSAAALDIQATPTGARISYGAETLLLHSQDGATILPSAFGEGDFLFF